MYIEIFKVGDLVTPSFLYDPYGNFSSVLEITEIQFNIYSIYICYCHISNFRPWIGMKKQYWAPKHLKKLGT
jgi:hypothetical protein